MTEEELLKIAIKKTHEQFDDKDNEFMQDSINSMSEKLQIIIRQAYRRGYFDALKDNNKLIN